MQNYLVMVKKKKVLGATWGIFIALTASLKYKILLLILNFNGGKMKFNINKPYQLDVAFTKVKEGCKNDFLR